MKERGLLNEKKSLVNQKKVEKTRNKLEEKLKNNTDILLRKQLISMNL